MRCPILGFFQLILGIFSKLTLDIVNKSLGISEVFSKKDFEFRSCDQSGTLMTILILSLSKADGAMRK